MIINNNDLSNAPKRVFKEKIHDALANLPANEIFEYSEQYVEISKELWRYQKLYRLGYRYERSEDSLGNFIANEEVKPIIKRLNDKREKIMGDLYYVLELGTKPENDK